MTERSGSAVGGAEGAAVERYFQANAAYWRSVYRDEGLQGLIYRQRMQLALSWIDEFAPAAGAEALEVGCGAGLLSVELARRGVRVTGTDVSSEMTALAAAHARAEGVGESVNVQIADVQALPFTTGSFRLVVALGVLPWLPDPAQGVHEMARVLAPGGLLVISADNRLRVNSLFGQNPLLSPPKAAVRAYRRRRHGVATTTSRLHTPRQVDGWLHDAGMAVVRRASVGFGPITLFGRPILPRQVSLSLHARLQAGSERGTPLVRWAGWHYLTAAVPAGPPAASPPG